MARPILTLPGWLLAAAVSAYACSLVVRFDTPIDAALPFIAVILTAVAAASHPAVMSAIPLLIVVETIFAGETMRLLSFGVVIAAAFAFAGSAHVGDEDKRGWIRAFTITTAAVLLLRWIPAPSSWLRELLLLAFVLAIVAVLRATPFAMLLGVLAALATPAIPLRTFVVPLAVLIVAALIRRFELRLAVPSFALLAALLLFFPWSGILVRATPYLLTKPNPATKRFLVNQALAAKTTTILDVPHGAEALIVSGANVAKMKAGTPLGTIEPGGFVVRIGDAADWAFLQRDTWFATRNPLPRDPAGLVRGYGYAAWLDGGGRVPLPRGAQQIRITADPHLPAGASLQVEAFELAP